MAAGTVSAWWIPVSVVTATLLWVLGFGLGGVIGIVRGIVIEKARAKAEQEAAVERVMRAIDEERASIQRGSIGTSYPYRSTHGDDYEGTVH